MDKINTAALYGTMISRHMRVIDKYLSHLKNTVGVSNEEKYMDIAVEYMLHPSTIMGIAFLFHKNMKYGNNIDVIKRVLKTHTMNLGIKNMFSNELKFYVLLYDAAMDDDTLDEDSIVSKDDLIVAGMDGMAHITNEFYRYIKKSGIAKSNKQYMDMINSDLYE